ncbi:aquaporin [Cellulomonas sp. NPDC057328]|uniref:aquaporin n=1 Tax=Cellulomonas sp. NPDC057328 TaxID=3346101 RepID=UPI00362EBD1C
MTGPLLARRALAELVGSACLLMIVVGSGVAATRLTDDVGLQLLVNSTTTALGLTVLIATLGPVSGAHLNPVVTVALVATRLWRATPRDVAVYVTAQLVGAASGTVLANLMFDLPAVTAATTVRSASSLWLAEVVATAGLVGVIIGLLRSAREAWVPAMVGCYIGAAYWFTSSTSFANPAVTLARTLSDTFAGIELGSVAPFLAAQVAGAALGAALAVALHHPSVLEPDADAPRTPPPPDAAVAVTARTEHLQGAPINSDA